MLIAGRMLNRSITGEVWLREMTRHVGQDLILARRASQDGKVHESARGIDVILRDHRIELIGDAICRIDPEIQTHLLRTGQCAEHAIGDILFGEAQNGSLGPIHGNIETRGVVRFLDPEVHQPRNLAECAQQLAGEPEDLVPVRSNKLNVDGCGQPEIQNLGDDVGGRKPNCDVRELLAHLQSNLSNKVVRRGMPFLQGDKDIAVRGADGAGVVVRGIDAAVGKAEIIDDLTQLISGNDLANHLLDLVDRACRLFDPRPGLHPHVHIETAGIDGGKEILPQEWETICRRPTRIRPPEK